MTGTLEIENEKRRENAPEEELQQQVGGLPRHPGKAPAQTRFTRRFGKVSRIAEGQPEYEESGPEQEGTETPQINSPDPLADGQQIPDKSPEKGGQGVEAAEDLQAKTLMY